MGGMDQFAPHPAPPLADNVLYRIGQLEAENAGAAQALASGESRGVDVGVALRRVLPARLRRLDGWRIAARPSDPLNLRATAR